MAAGDISPEWERWRGNMDAWRLGVDARFTRGDTRVEAMDKRQDDFDKELTRVTTKIAIAAGVGAVGGGALVTLILAFATKALGG